MDKTEFDEPILEGNYPVYPGYLYVVDGDVVASEIDGDVNRLKTCLKANEVRRCDMAARNLF